MLLFECFLLGNNMKKAGDFNPISKQIVTAPKPHYQHAISSLGF